jgi:hypothetical protein
MAKIYGNLETILGVNRLELPMDTELANGSRLDIMSFPEYILNFRTNSVTNLLGPFEQEEQYILNLQEQLIKKQLLFSYSTTPAIHFLWKNIFKIHPSEINSLEDFQRIPPVTKEHLRLLDWRNFLPAPIAEYFMEGAPKSAKVDPNLKIAQQKWTGGTTAKDGRDYVQVIMTEADWRASVQTMAQILKPAEADILSMNIGLTTYDMRHIARPIFEGQLSLYGKHLTAVPPGASDESILYIADMLGATCGVATPNDHPLKGIGWSGLMSEKKFRVALMSSTIPPTPLLDEMVNRNMTILNVGGDTGSLPTYYSLVSQQDYDKHPESFLVQKLRKLNTISMAPSYTEIVSPADMSFSQVGEEGVLLQTNIASVWDDGKQTYLVPALKTQMIRSSATGNLVKVISTDGFGRPNQFHHQILRYDDFRLDDSLRPIYGSPVSNGGTSKGGCAG